MPPEIFLANILDPGLAALTEQGGPPVSDAARRFLLAVALQESGPKLEARYQNSPSTSAGPARGWYMFEQGGGVVGVLNHTASKKLAQLTCNTFAVLVQPAAVWRALEGHDLLATCFARLLLWTDPAAIPTQQQPAWDCYMRLWRPGKPHADVWPGNWQTASKAIIDVPNQI